MDGELAFEFLISINHIIELSFYPRKCLNQYFRDISRFYWRKKIKDSAFSFSALLNQKIASCSIATDYVL